MYTVSPLQKKLREISCTTIYIYIFIYIYIVSYILFVQIISCLGCGNRGVSGYTKKRLFNRVEQTMNMLY